MHNQKSGDKVHCSMTVKPTELYFIKNSKVTLQVVENIWK